MDRPSARRHRGISAETKAALRRTDALIAETRLMLAQLKAGTFHLFPAAPPGLRLVGGTKWSANQAQWERNTPYRACHRAFVPVAREAAP